ncbi:guanylate kinase [Pararhodospirillum photometricum]|uniref:Guanylate kinase n=1 Tax=Pararhodospirillum photometricum DSM 122 TaxID=1150469 RepID=H6SNL7_PARPM|nr:guanylate kinase [Pararhodospirillum photometricum]CCG09348.1 Guanylate kinase [Pararhodospirillum photometricum DSM 122]
MTACPLPSRRGLLLVLSSPSGTGKSTIARALLESDPDLSLSVSVTTRAPRPGERDAIHYHFIDEARFAALVAEDGLLEHAGVYGKHYGSPRAPIEAALAAGRDVLFDIDWQGMRQLAAKARADMVSIFLLPPSLPELERRLRARAQDSEPVIAQRMALAREEISHYAEYGYVLINDDLARTIDDVRAILRAERLRRPRRVGLADAVDTLCRPLAP